MKLTCVALLACTSCVFAEGDDDLGLPQLNEPVPIPQSEPIKLEITKQGETQPYAVVDDVVIPLERSTARELMKGPSTDPAQTAAPALQPAPAPQVSVTSQTTTLKAPATSATIAPIAPPPPVAPAPTRLTLAPAPATTTPAPALTATATYIYPNYSAYGTPPPDRTGPMMDSERGNDRTRRPDAPVYRDDVTRQGRDYQRPPTKTRPGTDDTKPRDITQPRPNDYRFRDRTQQGPDELRPPDITRRRDR